MIFNILWKRNYISLYLHSFSLTLKTSIYCAEMPLNSQSVWQCIIYDTTWGVCPSGFWCPAFPGNPNVGVHITETIQDWPSCMLRSPKINLVLIWVYQSNHPNWWSSWPPKTKRNKAEARFYEKEIQMIGISIH